MCLRPYRAFAKRTPKLWILEECRSDRSALSAGVILGVIWGVWHLPGFILPGTTQNNMSFPLFMIGIVARSILMTWAFKGTSGSVLAAVLIHWIFNTCSDMTRMPLALLSRSSRDHSSGSGRNRRSGLSDQGNTKAALSLQQA